MGEVKLIFDPLILKIYGVQITILTIIIFLLIGITIYFVRKEFLNDK